MRYLKLFEDLESDGYIRSYMTLRSTYYKCDQMEGLLNCLTEEYGVSTFPIQKFLYPD